MVSISGEISVNGPFIKLFSHSYMGPPPYSIKWYLLIKCKYVLYICNWYPVSAATCKNKTSYYCVRKHWSKNGSKILNAKKMVNNRNMLSN